MAQFIPRLAVFIRRHGGQFRKLQPDMETVQEAVTQQRWTIPYTDRKAVAGAHIAPHALANAVCSWWLQCDKTVCNSFRNTLHNLSLIAVSVYSPTNRLIYLTAFCLPHPLCVSPSNCAFPTHCVYAPPTVCKPLLLCMPHPLCTDVTHCRACPTHLALPPPISTRFHLVKK